MYVCLMPNKRIPNISYVDCTAAKEREKKKRIFIKLSQGVARRLQRPPRLEAEGQDLLFRPNLNWPESMAASHHNDDLDELLDSNSSDELLFQNPNFVILIIPATDNLPFQFQFQVLSTISKISTSAILPFKGPSFHSLSLFYHRFSLQRFCLYLLINSSDIYIYMYVYVYLK